jgi:hypothetical protein
MRRWKTRLAVVAVITVVAIALGVGGTISACLRVPVGEGKTVIVVRWAGNQPDWDAGQPTPTGDWLTLTPSSGPPGTDIRISGFVGKAAGELRGVDYARACWATCDALQGSLPIQWSDSKRGHFSALFHVPAAPYFSGKTVVPLRTGRYAVIFPCLPLYADANGVCTTARLQAFFDLGGPASNQCATSSKCVPLQPTPGHGPPGSLVAIDGWAPLTGLPGRALVVVGFDVAQPTSGAGSAKVPVLASAAFTVTPSPRWSELPALHPVSIQRSGMDPIAVDPANPRRFAYCGDSVIRMTRDAGASWSTVSTAGVEKASASTDYPIPSPLVDPTICRFLALDGQYPATVYAGFESAPGSAGAPAYFVGYVSRDSGQTWQPLPVPEGHDMGDFGGFRVAATSVQALFDSLNSSLSTPVDAFSVEESTDGGASWQTSALHCPVRGPCLGLGPQIDRGCRLLPREWDRTEGSRDGGRTWSELGWPDQLSACTTGELIGLDNAGMAALDPLSPFTLRVALDGTNWKRIALPVLRGADAGAGNLPGPIGMLPDGRLLVAGPTWYLLNAGASAWCAVAPPNVSTGPASASPILFGDSLWWIDPDAGLEPEGAPRHLPISSIRC